MLEVISWIPVLQLLGLIVSAVRSKASQFDDGAIFDRAWDVAGGFSLATARYVLKLGFSDVDRDRMRQLAEKNRTGELSDSEAEILDSFIRVGDLIALLQSKARRILSERSTRNGRHE